MDESAPIDRLISNRNTIINLTSDLSEDHFHKKPEETAWSISEILTHLNMAETLLLEGLKKTISKESRMPWIKRYFFPMWLLVRFSFIKLKAPTFVLPQNVTQSSKNSLLDKYNKTRDELLLLANENKDRLRKGYVNHPILGIIDGKQALDFVGYHELRHIDQIERTLKKILPSTCT